MTNNDVRWYHEVLLVDAHNDTLSRMKEAGIDFCQRQGCTHTDLPRLMETGVNLQVLAMFAPPNPNKTVTLQKILSYVEYALQCQEDDSRLFIVETKDDLMNLKSDAGKLGVILGVEGGDCLGGELWTLRFLFRLGVRLLTLTWSNRNALADGIWEAESKGGLTSFGRQVVREMEQLGMIIDVSHLAPAGFWDVSKLVNGPFIASHSNAAALCQHPRNLTDEQARCIADHGGVIGVNFCQPHLTDDKTANLDDVIDHIEHFWRVAGEDHVGLGSDYDGIDTPPEGLEDVTCLPLLIEELEKRGHSARRIEKFMGLNLLRVFATILPCSSKTAAKTVEW